MSFYGTLTIKQIILPILHKKKRDANPSCADIAARITIPQKVLCPRLYGRNTRPFAPKSFFAAFCASKDKPCVEQT
jgi:hypothetical protein